MVPIAAPNTGTEIAANASERVQTERASRRSAGAEGEGEVIRVDISVGAVYLAIVPLPELYRQAAVRQTLSGSGLFRCLRRGHFG